MKYFIKLFPTTDKPVDGDLVQIERPIGHILLIIKGNNAVSQDGALTYPLDKVTPIKLKAFLCSRDIKVDDKIYNNYVNDGLSSTCTKLFTDEDREYQWDGIVNDETYFNFTDWYKIVGEVSPDATWIRNNDEFDEEDLCLLPTNMHGQISYIPKEPLKFSEERLIELQFIKIGVKGPCGHFH
jgi:hypothetical protein